MGLIGAPSDGDWIAIWRYIVSHLNHSTDMTDTHLKLVQFLVQKPKNVFSTKSKETQHFCFLDNSATKQQISWVVYVWLSPITFVWPGVPKQCATTAPSSQSERHLTVFCIDEIVSHKNGICIFMRCGHLIWGIICYCNTACSFRILNFSNI